MTKRRAPTSPPDSAQQTWSDRSCRSTLKKAWGDTSPLELGREMPKTDGARGGRLPRDPRAPTRTVELTSRTFLGSSRRDPRSILRARGERRCAPTTDRVPQGASATGSFVDASRRSRGPCGRPTSPARSAASVAPERWCLLAPSLAFGVGVSARTAHANRAKTSHRLVSRSNTAGDGCPGVVTVEGRCLMAAKRY
jgi:hypothetical protein